MYVLCNILLGQSLSSSLITSRCCGCESSLNRQLASWHYGGKHFLSFPSRCSTALEHSIWLRMLCLVRWPHRFQRWWQQLRTVRTTVPFPSVQQLLTAQADDPDCRAICKAVKAGTALPSFTSRSRVDFVVDADGLLCAHSSRYGFSVLRPVVPPPLRSHVRIGSEVSTAWTALVLYVCCVYV